MRLETERVTLRPLSMDDLDALAEFYADPEVMRYIGSGGPIDRERTRQSIDRMIGFFETDGFGQLAVERNEDGALIGRCGLLAWDVESWTTTTAAGATRPVEIEVGYLLGREFWGQGYATEAAIAVRDWALENLDLDRLIALIYPENAGSIAVALRLGMKPDGEVAALGSRVTRYALGNRPAR